MEEQFDDLDQQRSTQRLGMWVFLATEIMLFGGLFVGFTAYQHTFSHAFAEGSRQTEFWLGTINTAVLLTSSLTMAMAVTWSEEAEENPGRAYGVRLWLLAGTLLLGLVFMGIKGCEYYEDWHKHLIPGPNFQASGANLHQLQLFFLFYFFMTGLHAIHLTIGICLISYLLFKVWRHGRKLAFRTHTTLFGLYWHLVDIVWVFLYPILYLTGRHP